MYKNPYFMIKKALLIIVTDAVVVGVMLLMMSILKHIASLFFVEIPTEIGLILTISEALLLVVYVFIVFVHLIHLLKYESI